MKYYSSLFFKANVKEGEEEFVQAGQIKNRKQIKINNKWHRIS